MKKIIGIISVMLIFLLAFGTLGFFTFKYYKGYIEYEKIKQEQVKIYEEEKENEAKKLEQEEENRKYLEENVLDNNIPIGLYTIQGGKLVRTSKWDCDWSRDSIFGLFYALASDEDTVEFSNYKQTFKDYWNKYNTQGYKIGYNLKFSLDTGEIINQRILSPQNTDDLFKHIQFYLYDDVTDMPGRRYYHMREFEMTDETMLTSVKLVGYKETKGVNGPIELSVFTYNGDEDFDKDTGEYLGNSKFTMKIYRKQV